jgi:class 3 adenylate cyclase
VSTLVVEYTNKYCEWVMGLVSNAIDATPTVKFMGDGAAFVWEVPVGTRLIDLANAVVGLACALDGGYSRWHSENTDGMPEVPKHIGVGVDFGDASRLTSESGSYEYLGLPLSYAAKMQALARPNGGVVIRDKWTLPDYLRSKFTKIGSLTIGDECIPVRATGRVKFKPAKLAQPEADDIGLA